MLDPVLTDVATMQPGTCWLCRTIKGPFVDTRVQCIEGRVYVCVETCAAQIAGLSGFVSAVVLAERDAQLAETVAEIIDLEAALEQAEAQQVVPIAEVERLLSRGQNTGFASGEWETRTLSIEDDAKIFASKLTPPRCTTPKKDGSPCSGAALPGRDTCVAHTRVAA